MSICKGLLKLLDMSLHNDTHVTCSGIGASIAKKLNKSRNICSSITTNTTGKVREDRVSLTTAAFGKLKDM